MSYAYKLNPALTEDQLMKLVGQAPQQAGAILIALSELRARNKFVDERELIPYIGEHLDRLSPRAKDKSVIPGFVAYYRTMLCALPETILSSTKGPSTRGSGGGKRSAAVTLIDPVTGEEIPNPFLRKPVKNPGIRAMKAKTQELLGDMEEMEELEEGEEPVDELEEATEENTSPN